MDWRTAVLRATNTSRPYRLMYYGIVEWDDRPQAQPFTATVRFTGLAEGAGMAFDRLLPTAPLQRALTAVGILGPVQRQADHVTFRVEQPRLGLDHQLREMLYGAFLALREPEVDSPIRHWIFWSRSRQWFYTTLSGKLFPGA